MKRRNFLRTAGVTAALTPFCHNGFALNPLSKNSMFGQLGAAANLSGKVMVFIELNGGNDGLNTLIPLDQYSNLFLHRGGILIPENKVLNLNGVDATGLHPSMTGLKEMYDDGLLSIVQNVGYPEQDYSHFRSMDIWQSGSDSSEYLDTGWMGRALESEYPAFPEGYPNPDNPDPLAIQVGGFQPLSFMGSSFPMGMVVPNNPSDFDNTYLNEYVEPAPATPYGDELEYIRLVYGKSQEYFDVIKNAVEAQPSNLSSLYPSGNELADQLRIVARLIGGGLTTPVYVVSIGRFDTHSEQVDSAAHEEGLHAELLGNVSSAIYAFQDDLRLMGKDDNVAGMTYSEFGRTIASNFSVGTDHGAAAPLFVFGKGVNPGIIGENAQIPQNLDQSADVPMAHDFRQVYASVLQDWFGLTNIQDILFHDFDILPIFKGSSPSEEFVNRNRFEVSNYPNPVRTSTTITFTSFSNANVVINLMDSQGRFIMKIVEGSYPTGVHRIRFDRSNLPSGTYLYQVRLNGIGVTKKMLVF
ncbi:MAG: DUF1501 domain-containing protein [Bacteroidetes bacterium]|nr:DUF1501 domain-containing protein [Bacteroidota bacterium]